jgi:ribosomal protein L3
VRTIPITVLEMDPLEVTWKRNTRKRGRKSIETSAYEKEKCKGFRYDCLFERFLVRAVREIGPRETDVR